jgi:hypothetical protein
MEPTPAPSTYTSPPPPRTTGGFDWSDFINFRYLITPGLVTVIYVLGAVFITLGAIGVLLAGGTGGVIGGLLIFVFGNLYWRVILEFIIVLFRINEGIRSIDQRGRGV